MKNNKKPGEMKDFSKKLRVVIILTLTGTLHGQCFACACRPLTNRRAALMVDNFQADR